MSGPGIIVYTVICGIIALKCAVSMGHILKCSLSSKKQVSVHKCLKNMIHCKEWTL